MKQKYSWEYLLIRQWKYKFNFQLNKFRNWLNSLYNR